MCWSQGCGVSGKPFQPRYTTLWLMRLIPVGLPLTEAIKALGSHTELFVLGRGGVNAILTRADLHRGSAAGGRFWAHVRANVLVTGLWGVREAVSA